MLTIHGARAARRWSGVALAVAMVVGTVVAGAGSPFASAVPGDPIAPVDRLSVDKDTQTASVAGPGGNAALTTTMQATTINPVVDIVFVLDTTGSMDAKIATMQAGLGQFVKNITDAGGTDLAFGVMIFGSIGDGATPRWTRPLAPLSSPQDLNYLFSGLGQLNSSGNAEDMVHAGFTAAATAPWRPGAQREEIVVGDIGSREWPYATNLYINGQPPTLANWKAYADANGINVHVVDASGRAPGSDDGWSYLTNANMNYRSFTDMATAFNTNPNFSTTAVTTVTAAMYVSHLTDEVVFKNGTISFTIEPRVSVTYADGTPSTDVVATVTPSVATTVDTSAPTAFTLQATAVAAANITRPGATTTAYLELVDQATGSIVARQTITLTAPNAQTASVVFVDDDNGGATVSPVAGFTAVFTGMPGTAVGFTEVAARAGVPAGFVFVSLDNVAVFDDDDAVDQVITVHVKHALDVGSVTTTRTVHYTGAGAATPADVTQSVVWDSVTDAVSHVTTYTASSAGYPVVASPVVPGYTADRLSVPVLSVVSPTTTAPSSTSVTVTYTPNVQVVNVVFVDDDDAGVVVAPVSGFVSRLSGPSGGAVGFTQAMAEAGIPAGFVFVSLDNVGTYDFDDAADQTVTVHVKHALNNGTVTTTRTITYVGAGVSTPPVVRQSVSWSTVTDAVTHVTTYTAGAASYPGVTSPLVPGYTADVLSVPVLPVVSPTTTAPVSTSVTVTYTPNTQVVNVVFVDDDDAGVVVVPVSGFVSRLSGLSGAPVGFTQTMAEGGVPAGFVFASLDNVMAFDFDDAADQVIRVHLVHGLTHGTVTTTRTVTYVGAGVFTPPVVTQSLTWDTVTDLVTHVTTFTARQVTYPVVSSPVVQGYTADKLSVAVLAVVSPTTTAPVSTGVMVTYTPDTQIVNVVFVDDDASGVVVVPVVGFVSELSGPSGGAVNFTEAMARAGVPAGYMFVSLSNVANYDYDDAADQTITVHVNHGLRDGVVSTSRTIHYVGAGVFTPPDVTQVLSWSTVTDLVTGVVTYTAGGASYPGVASPLVAGYTADRLGVAVLPVVSPTTVAPSSTDVTVTYAPNMQVVNVVFVDDDAAGAVVAPVAGFVSGLSGLSGSPVGFTEAIARAGVPDVFVFVSLDNVTSYDFDDAADQTITVHVEHRLDEGTLTTTRTVRYTGASLATPPDVRQNVVWGTVTDAVTHVTTYTAGVAGYAGLTSPLVAGYTADVLVVAALPVVSPTTTAPVSTSVTVTYTPNTQVVNVVFVDDDAAGVVVTPVASFQARLTGLSGSAIGFSETTARAGVPAGYVFASLDNVANYDFADGVDQTITVHLVHGHDVSALVTTRTVHYVGAAGLTPADVTQSVDWVVTEDLPTGVIVYTTSTAGYAAVPTPVLNGYTADVVKVDAVAVPGSTQTRPESTAVTVTYTVKQQQVKVVFVDDDAKGAVVDPEDGFDAVLSGPGGGPVGFTQAMAEKGVPAGYLVASLDNVAVYDLDDAADQVVTVHLVHQIITETFPVTRTIHYVGAGDATPPDEVQTIEWLVSADAVTHAMTYTTDAAGYTAVSVPVLAGYTVDRASVDALPVVAETDVMPVSTTETVTYTPIIIIPTGGTSTPAGLGAWLLMALLMIGAGVTGATRIVRRTR